MDGPTEGNNAGRVGGRTFGEKWLGVKDGIIGTTLVGKNEGISVRYSIEKSIDLVLIGKDCSKETREER